MLQQAPDQALLERELAIALVQRARLAKDANSLAEAAVLLVALRRRGALEAQYHELADRLAKISGP